MPLSPKNQIYFDSLQINEGAYFYSRIGNIDRSVVRDAFDSVETAVVGYQQICRVIKEQVSFDGKTAKVSLLIFYSSGTPAFLPVSNPRLALSEQTVGYLLIIEIGDHVALFSRHAKGLSDFKKHLQPISPSELCGAIWTEDTLFSRIQASNMNMNPMSLRNKSWEAYDLSSVISTSGTNHNAANGVKMSRAGDSVYVSLTTSRVSKFASDRKHITELCRWCDEIVRGILNPNDISKSFLRHFAKPVKWKDFAKKLKPTVLLIDTFSLQTLIEEADLHFMYDNGYYGRKLSRDFVLSGLKKLGNCYPLQEAVPNTEYSTPTQNPSISIRNNLSAIRIDATGVLGNIKVIDESVENEYAKQSLFSLINSRRAFAVAFDKFEFMYCNGSLHLDEGIINNLDRVLSIFQPLDRMSEVTSEKGDIVGKVDFQPNTVFNVVEEYFRNNGAIHIVCDDMGYEVADHIVVTDHSISFIHSKATGKDPSLSASNFQVVIGQALKNIGSVRELNLRKKVADWKGKCFKDSGIPVFRYGNLDDFSKDYSSVLGSPNGIKEICIAIDFVSKSKLADAFGKLKSGTSFQQKNYVIQMVWLLNDFISACKEADMNCRIFCKE